MTCNTPAKIPWVVRLIWLHSFHRLAVYAAYKDCKSIVGGVPGIRGLDSLMMGTFPIVQPGGSSGGGEEGSNRIEGDNKGVVAGGGRLRAEGGNRSKGRSAGGRVIQGLVLLMLCTIGGADTGGRWKGLTPVRGEERSLKDNRGGECWSGGSWQQARGAVAGGSWQKAPAGGSGSSSASSGSSSRSANGGASSRRLEGGWPAALGGSNKGAARGCSQCSIGRQEGKGATSVAGRI